LTEIIVGTIEDNGPHSSALSKTPVILVAQALIVLSSFQLIRKRIQKMCNFQMSVQYCISKYSILLNVFLWIASGAHA
jgi:hypothetical protein